MILYTKKNIANYFFSTSCDVLYRRNRIIISKKNGTDAIAIEGNSFVIKKVYENLTLGVEREVLLNLLKQIGDETLFDKLESEKYIE